MIYPGYADIRRKKMKKRIIAGALAVIISASAAAGAVFCYSKFNNDPYWQLLHSANKMKNAESFSFELKTTQNISLDIPVLSEQSFESETLYKGDVEFDKDGSELILRAQSDDGSILLYKDGGKWITAHKGNEADSEWTVDDKEDNKENDKKDDIVYESDAETVMYPNHREVLAIGCFKGFKFFTDAKNGYDFLTEYSDLYLERAEDKEQISGDLKLSKMLESAQKSGSGEKNSAISAIMGLFGGEYGSISLNSMEITDGEICWENTNNYPSELSLDYSVTFDAAQVLSEMAKDSPELQAVIDFLGDVIETDANCSISAELSISDYGNAFVETEDIEDLIS